MSTTLTHDILETIMSSPVHSTLARMIKAADLDDALQQAGPLTIFAPTNDAFKEIPQETLEVILENQEILQSILKNHIVPGKHMSGDIVYMNTLETIDGGLLQVNIDHGCKINNAGIARADILCSNGVIHVIDMILLPDKPGEGK